MREARVMWDGTINGQRCGGPLHLRVDHIGDLVARFNAQAHGLPLDHLQRAARELAIALELVEVDFAGRIIIEEPSRRDPVDRSPTAEPDGSLES